MLIKKMIERDQGWFRLCGVGLLWKHASIPALYSERHGHTRFWRIPRTPWRVRLLGKEQ